MAKYKEEGMNPYLEDVALLVEEQVITIPRFQLMAASPFFEAMLKSHNFKEANSNVIPLPGKMPAAIKFMVDYIKSGFMAPIPDDDDLQLLQQTIAVGDEYLITRLKRDCEDAMLDRVGHHSDPAETLTYLYYAQKYDMPRIKTKTEEILAGVEYEALEFSPAFGLPELSDVFRQRTEKLEQDLGRTRRKSREIWSEFLRGFDVASLPSCGIIHHPTQIRCPGDAALDCDGNRLRRVMKYVSEARGNEGQVRPIVKEFLDQL